MATDLQVRCMIGSTERSVYSRAICQLEMLHAFTLTMQSIHVSILYCALPRQHCIAILPSQPL